MSFLLGPKWTLAFMHYTLQLFQDGSVCPCAPTSLQITTFCCSLRMAPSAAGRSGCSCSTCTHGHRATFVTTASMPSPDCLADLPGSFCTETRLFSPAVLHLSNSLISSLSGILPLLPESYLRLCCVLSLALVPILSTSKHIILPLGWLHLPWGTVPKRASFSISKITKVNKTM